MRIFDKFKKIFNNLKKNKFNCENEQQRHVIIDEPKLKSIKEVFELIKVWNGIHTKEKLNNKLNYNLTGYAKKFFENKFNKLGKKENRLLDYDGILAECSGEAAPGAVVCGFGYIPIATTIGGNSVCIDLNSSLDNPRVVLADHSVFCDIEPSFFVVTSEPRWTQKLVDENVEPVRNSLEEFVNDIENGKLDIYEDLD